MSATAAAAAYGHRYCRCFDLQTTCCLHGPPTVVVYGTPVIASSADAVQ